ALFSTGLASIVGEESDCRYERREHGRSDCFCPPAQLLFSLLHFRLKDRNSSQHGNGQQAAQILISMDAEIEHFHENGNAQRQNRPEDQAQQVEFESVWPIRFCRKAGWINHTEEFSLALLHQVGGHFRLRLFVQERLVRRTGLLMITIDLGKLLLPERGDVEP